MKKILALAVLLCTFAFTVKGQSQNDVKAVREAILNYVESFYNADTSKVYASVHPELAKRGYSKRGENYRESTMNFNQMVSLSARWNKTNPVPKDAPKEVTIFEIKDKIATAKVKAMWGTDYFHLAKGDNGQWKVVNVLWQN